MSDATPAAPAAPVVVIPDGYHHLGYTGPGQWKAIRNFLLEKVEFHVAAIPVLSAGLMIPGDFVWLKGQQLFVEGKRKRKDLIDQFVTSAMAKDKKLEVLRAALAPLPPAAVPAVVAPAA